MYLLENITKNAFFFPTKQPQVATSATEHGADAASICHHTKVAMLPA
jgi:hypothetical protein